MLYLFLCGVMLIANSYAFPTFLKKSFKPLNTLYNVRELVHALQDPYDELLDMNAPVEEAFSPSVQLESSITLAPVQRPRTSSLGPWERQLRQSIYNLNKYDKQRRIGESEEKRKDRKAFKRLMIDTLEMSEGRATHTNRSPQEIREMLNQRQEDNLVPEKFIDLVLIVFVYRLCSLTRLELMEGFNSPVMDFRKWMRSKQQKQKEGEDKTLFIRKVKRFVVDRWIKEEHGNPLPIFNAEGDRAGKQTLSRMELSKLLKPSVLDEITDVLEKNYAVMPKNRYLSPEEKERMASATFLAEKYSAVRDWHKPYVELLGTPSLPFKPQNETVFKVDDVPMFLPNYSTEDYFVIL